MANMIVSKLRAKNLGNPKVAAGFSDEEMGAGKVHVLGVIMGKASGVKAHKNPKDETQVDYSLVGFFEGIPDDKQRPRLQSGICWLPGGIHEMVREQVESAAEGQVVEFAFKIGTRRSTNQAGYEYVTEPMGEATKADPLADLRERLSSQLALPVPEKESANEKRPARARR